jgi:hypothetical protein
MFLLPYFVVLNLIIEPIQLLLADSDSLNRLINHRVILKELLPDVLSAVGTLTSPQQTLIDALFTERVPTHCCLARNDQVHADRALQALHVSEVI